jgi:transposase
VGEGVHYRRWTPLGDFLMSRRRKHRLWTVEEKQSICRQARAPGVSVAQVALRYALNSNLIFKWLRDPRFAPATDEVEAVFDGPVFLPVDVRAELTPAFPPNAPTEGLLEVSLASGHQVTVRGAYDVEALARLLKSLVSS